MDDLAEVREFFRKALAVHGDRHPVSDSSSIFVSGRLSSVDAVELVVLLEEKFGVDFTESGFDLVQIDSIDAIRSLVSKVRQ